jgi:hypothetical protein
VEEILILVTNRVRQFDIYMQKDELGTFLMSYSIIDSK